MALALGVGKGSVIYLNDIPLEVLSVLSKEEVVVDVLGKSYVITQKESVEVYPNVYVSVGLPSKVSYRSYSDKKARLLFEAPKSVLILRKDLYDRSQSDHLA